MNKFEMCEDCKRDAGTMNLYRLCCATRRVMNHALATLPLREQCLQLTLDRHAAALLDAGIAGSIAPPLDDDYVPALSLEAAIGDVLPPAIREALFGLQAVPS